MSARLLVFAPNWLGDAVMAIPALDDLRRAEPSGVIDVAARPSVAALFTLVSSVGRVVALGDERASLTILRDAGYDAAILLPNSFNVARLARRAGIPERWGYRGDFRALLLTRGLTPPVRVHQVEYYRQLVQRLGFPVGEGGPRIDLPEAAKMAGRALLMASGCTLERPLVAVAPGAASGNAKRWPARSFAALVAGLAAEGVTAVLVGSPADRPAAAELIAALPSQVRPVDLVGRTDLPTLAGVLVHCRALVTNDSGAMHLAAALGVSVAAMFGPTIDRETRPIGSGRVTVLTNDVWCRPCMLRDCPLTHACMTGIRVEAVMGATRQLL